MRSLEKENARLKKIVAELELDKLILKESITYLTTGELRQAVIHTYPNHVWAIDFVHDKLCNGRSYKMLTVLDEYTRQVLAVAVRTRMGAEDVLEALYPLLLRHGAPEYIRSDNGPEFVAEAMQD